MIIPVILSGGVGSRLWPLSRSAFPKQFTSLFNSNTLLKDTIIRSCFLNINPILVANELHRFIIEEQLSDIAVQPKTIILEPEGRNTAPAITLAALYALEALEDPILLIMPADHAIQDGEVFVSTVRFAEQFAERNQLVTFGCVPDSPQTGYGYIKAGDALFPDKAYIIAKFVEKPTRVQAEAYINSGQYYWNSGIFMFRAAIFIEEIRKYAPDILQSCQDALQNCTSDKSFLHINTESFLRSRSESVDYAVMEKTDKAVIVPLNVGWSDIGSWESLHDCQSSDADGNVVIGDVKIKNVENSYIHASHRMIAALDVKDCVIIETRDVILVANRNSTQNVKQLVNALDKENRSEAHFHSKISRPWGHYETLEKGVHFQVKRITIKPKASISLQLHHHRSEHWIVVNGIACVTCGEKIFTLKQNESTYIPVQTKHRLENIGKTPLEIIEVQSGEYLGEDDIVRFEDSYGRITENEVVD